MHTVFFGDRERTFALPLPQLEELERVTDCGIGEMFFHRIKALAFRHSDLAQVIRLALIGGGESPKEAAELVAAYVSNRPLGETLPIALAVLEAVMFGNAASQTAASVEG
ncbi:MAG: gene transfer agent family protein [Methylobacterium mesophilicum]|nr:gene transfer agent family protein [Methylobacterium mesophilicum]